MHRPLALPRLCLGLLLLAAPMAAQILRVERVSFAPISPGGSANWLEIAVEVSNRQAQPLVEPLDVSLQLGFLPQSNATGLIYYRCTVQIAGLPENSTRVLYFYLPPDVLELKELPREPFAWLVEFSVQGAPLPLSPDSLSRELQDPARLDRFRLNALQEAAPQEGQLLPIYHTPFFSPFFADKLNRSPAYIRREQPR